MPNRPRSLRTLSFATSKRKPSPEPPSPTFSDVTDATALNFGPNGPEKIITRANLKASIQAYEALMTTSAEYRAALMTMSKATAAFADALERCSGLKGPTYEAGTRLQAASGLHHLIGNHWHVLAETVEKKFEKPLRQHLDNYRAIVKERSASYEHAVREKSQLIRDTEMRSMNRKERNLQTFREALNLLQRQVDDLDNMKASHYREIVDHEEQVWEVVQGRICIVVRSTMDVLDRFTAKASDPIIELMLQSVPDPFDSYGPQPAEDQIFSILAPLSIMPTPSSESPAAEHAELDPAETTPSADISTWLSSSGAREVYSDAPRWTTFASSPSTPPRHSSSSNAPQRHTTPPIAVQGQFNFTTLGHTIDSGSRFDDSNVYPNSLDSPPHQKSTVDGNSSPDTGQHQRSEWATTGDNSSHSVSTEEDARTPQRQPLLFPTDTLRHQPPEKADETIRAIAGVS